MNLEEIQHMRSSKSYSVKILKSISHEEMAEQVRRFIEGGGYIKKIPQGVSGEEQMALRRSMAMSTGSKASAKAKKSSFGILKASQLIGVSHAWLIKQCNLGIGPPFYMSGKSRQFLRDEVLAWWANREESGS